MTLNLWWGHGPRSFWTVLETTGSGPRNIQHELYILMVLQIPEAQLKAPDLDHFIYIQVRGESSVGQLVGSLVIELRFPLPS